MKRYLLGLAAIAALVVLLPDRLRNPGQASVDAERPATVSDQPFAEPFAVDDGFDSAGSFQSWNLDVSSGAGTYRSTLGIWDDFRLGERLTVLGNRGTGPVDIYLGPDLATPDVDFGFMKACIRRIYSTDLEFLVATADCDQKPTSSGDEALSVMFAVDAHAAGPVILSLYQL